MKGGNERREWEEGMGEREDGVRNGWEMRYWEKEGVGKEGSMYGGTGGRRKNGGKDEYHQDNQLKIQSKSLQFNMHLLYRFGLACRQHYEWQPYSMVMKSGYRRHSAVYSCRGLSSRTSRGCGSMRRCG